MALDFLLGIGLGTIIIVTVWYALIIVASWRIFSKAGEAGWKSLIPVYNEYIIYKISWKTSMFWAMLALTLLVGIFDKNPSTIISIIKYVVAAALAVIEVIAYNKLAKSFDKGIGFTLGLIFLTPIFMLILGLGDAQYLGNTSEM